MRELSSAVGRSGSPPPCAVSHAPPEETIDLTAARGKAESIADTLEYPMARDSNPCRNPFEPLSKPI